MKARLMMMVVLLAAMTVVSIGRPARADVLIVDDDTGASWADYDSIQEAMDDAESGDRIRVFEGVYRENLIHNKSVSVIGNGSDRSRIHCIYSGFAIDFVSGGRFTRMNVTMGRIGNDPGPMMPRLMGSNRIDNCTFHTGSIFVHYAGGYDIDNNTFWKTGLYSDGTSDARVVNNIFRRGGIYYDRASDIHVAFNRFKGVNSSLAFGQECQRLTVEKNKFFYTGIGLASIERALIVKNQFKGIGGIYVNRGHNVTMGENTFVASGIFLGSYIEDETLSHTIRDDNLVDGKPVIFIKNETDPGIPADVAQLIIANCSWTEIEDYTLSEGAGLSFLWADNTTVANVTMSGSGIHCYSADNLTVSDCTIDAAGTGIYLGGAVNVLIEDTWISNSSSGIDLPAWGEELRITNCTLDSNKFGITIGYPTSNVSIDNCTIDGQLDAVRKYRISGIRIWKGTDVVIENNTISNTTGIDLNEADRTVVQNCELWDCIPIYRNFHEGGLNMGKTEYATVRNVTITGAGVSLIGDLYGRYPREWDSNEMSDVTVNHRPLGFFLDEGDLGTVPSGYGQMIIVNCSRGDISSMTYGDTFVPITIAMSDNITVSDLDLARPDGTGINVVASENLTFSDIEVTDASGGSGIQSMMDQYLSFSGLDISGADRSGLFLSGALDVTISDSRFRDNGMFGLEASFVDAAVIENCTSRDNGFGAMSALVSVMSEVGVTIVDNVLVGGNNSLMGVLKLGLFQGVVRNNEISGGKYDGIRLHTRESCTIEGNRVFNNSLNGIMASGTEYVNITGNTVTDNGGSGIYLYTCDYNNITGNLIADNGDYGVSIYTDSEWSDSVGNMVHGNTFRGNGNHTSQGWENSNTSFWDDNSSKGNVWSDYTGVDENGDGIGDTPYPIDGHEDAEDRWPIVRNLTVLYVDDDNAGDPLMNGTLEHPFDTIQKAIDNASEDFSVRVFDGLYVENVTVAVDGLWLIGNGSSTTTIDGGDSGTPAYIGSALATIDGFRITGSGTGRPGIHVNGTSGVTVRSVEVDGCTYGVLVGSSSTVVVSNVTARDNQEGIRIDDCEDVTVRVSSLGSNPHSGVRLLSSAGCSVRDCTFDGNGVGIQVSDSDDSRIARCTIDNSTGNGVTIDTSSSGVRIEKCTLDGNAGSVSSTSSTVTVGNTTLSPVGGDDIDARLNTLITTINVSFDADGVSCDPASRVVVRNYLHIGVKDQYDDPVQDADVLVEDNGMAVYATSGYEGSDPGTNGTGWIDRILVTDRVHDGSDTATQNVTDVTAAYGDAEETAEVDMSSGHTEVIELYINEPPTVRITKPDDGDVLDRDIHIRGRSSDPDARDNVTTVEVAVFDDGGTPGPGDWIEAEDISDDGDWDRWRIPWNASGEDEGNYTISARSHDGDEWSEEVSIGVTVIHQDLPVINVSEPEEGDEVSGQSEVEGTAEDEDWTDEIEGVRIAIVPENEEPASGDWLDAEDTSSGDPYATWVLSWNSSDHEDGNYTIHAKAVSSNGDFSNTTLINITIENDNFRPEVTITEPEEDEGVRETVTIAGHVVDEDDGIDTIVCSIDDPEFDETLPLEIERVEWNRWSFETEWDTKRYGVGLHRIYTMATDERGQDSRLWMINVSIINVTPEIGFTVLKDGKEEIDLEHESVFTIEWIDSDPDDDAKITLVRDTNDVHGDGNATEEVNITTGLSEDGLDSYDWDLTGVPGGKYYIVAVIDDGINAPFVNCSSHRLHVIQVVPNVPPEIAITNMVQDMDVEGQFEVAGTAGDVDGSVEAVAIRIGSGPWTDCTDDSGDWSEWSHVWDSADHPDGTITVTARALDDGNGTSLVTFDVRVDNTELRRPSVTIVDPASGSGPHALTVEMTGTAMDPEGALDRVEVSVGDDGFDDPGTCSGTSSWTVTVDVSALEMGHHTLYARAVDAEGLISLCDLVTIQVDNRRPVAVIESLAPAETTVEVGTFTFRGRGENGDIVEYEWSDGSGNVVGDSDTEHCPASILGIGQHTILFRVKGENGLWSDPVSETITVIEEPDDAAESRESGDRFMAIMGVIALVLIVLTVVGLRRRNGNVNVDAWSGEPATPSIVPRSEADPAPVGVAPPAGVACPTCGSPAVFYPQYGRHYCHTCQAYVPEVKMPEITIADHDE